ncbi:hypothetical protein [Salinisphaera sp.]|uniref:hypothetical protein n=1 Tax=Salinisphaera sp. TaxID=1914330 RepID=UPI000C573D1E|nr:hypothetical protein [Salinisphaera sp.]MAS10298.1 hypothetical protein [Salinisphaera sp.]
MPSGSLGTLSVDLVAKTGGFDRNLDQAQKRTETFDRKMRRFSRNMNRHFSDIARSATQLAAGLTGVSVAVGAVMKSQSDMVKRANETAQALDIATGELQAFQFATGKVGIESDKAADILKDLSDKIGDVALTGGGELADPLEKLGLSADNLIKLKPVEMLTEIGNAISSLPAAAQVNILESMADEGSRLRPLLKDNAELLRLYTQRARELNLANSEIDVQKILQFWQAWDRVADAIKGLVRTATIELAPSLSDAADEMQRFIKESGETGKIKTFFDSLREQLDDIKNTLGDIAKFGSNALIARLFGITTATVSGTAQIAGSSSDMGRRLQSGTPTEEDLASLSKERLAALRQMYEERGRASTQRATQYPLGSDLNEANQKAADKYWDAALMIDRAMDKGPLKIDITRSANEPGTQDKPNTGRTNLPSGKTLAAGMTEAEQRHLEAMQKSQDKYREWLDLQEQRTQGVSDLIQQLIKQHSFCKNAILTLA